MDRCDVLSIQSVAGRICHTLGEILPALNYIDIPKNTQSEVEFFQTL